MYEDHLAATAPGRRDLRFKPQTSLTGQGADEVEVFQNLPMGDLWEDAGLVDCLVYLMNSKKVRPQISHVYIYIVEGRVYINPIFGKDPIKVDGDYDRVLSHISGPSSCLSTLQNILPSFTPSNHQPLRCLVMKACAQSCARYKKMGLRL